MSLKKLIAGGVLTIGLIAGIPHCDRDVYTGTVIEKVSRVKGDNSKYLVTTELEESGATRTFEVADSPLELKFSSSDRWAEIKKGHTYEFSTFGWRIPFLSSYENIVGFDEVAQDTTYAPRE
jgi:hypothetical protein